MFILNLQSQGQQYNDLGFFNTAKLNWLFLRFLLYNTFQSLANFQVYFTDRFNSYNLLRICILKIRWFWLNAISDFVLAMQLNYISMAGGIFNLFV